MIAGSNVFRLLAAQWLRQTVGQQVGQAIRGAIQGELEARNAAEQAGQEALPPSDLAVLFALEHESGGFVDVLSQSVTTRCAALVEHYGLLGTRRVVVGETGGGREAAYRAALDLIAMHRPPWVITAGFAGGLTAATRQGHIVLASSVVDETGREWKIPGSWGTPTGSVHVGRLLTVDRLIRTTAEKADLAARHGAIACDMETAGIVRACEEKGVRCLSVRIISDGLEDELPPEIERILEQQSLAQKLGAATGAVFRRPSSVKDMWNLRERALIASDRLAKFLTQLIPQIVRENPERSAP
ncbi:MAG: 5-methylthioadenosine/S-adenosylhomocysteine nucleosidase [Planctomycetota bacterium]